MKESKTYNETMQGTHIIYLSQAIIEGLNSLHKNNNQMLIPKEKMQTLYQALGEKYVY